MENTALILIVITLLLLVVILGLLSFMVFKLLKERNTSNSQTDPNLSSKPDYHPEILARMKEVEKFKKKKSELFCPNHPDEPGETHCAICDRLFCRSCISPFKTMHLCKEHLPLLMRHDWVEVLTLKTSTHDPEDGVKLYDQKKKIFETEDLPTYVETHYKINVAEDYVETFLVVFSIKDQLERAKEKFSEFM